MKGFRRIAMVLTAVLLALAACTEVINQPGDGGGNGGDGGNGGGGNGGGGNNGGGNNGGGNGGGGNSDGSVSVNLSASPQSGQIPLEVTLNAKATDSDGGRLSYQWTVPGARENVRADDTYTTLITEPGNATFEVTVSNGGDTATDEVTVEATEPVLVEGNGRPVLDNDVQVNPEEGVAPLAVTFTARASDPDGDALDYIWDFGDGSDPVGGGATITHTYTEPSYYPVKVLVSDGGGGVDSAEAGVVVVAPPATLELDVTPDDANWEVYNLSEDDYYGFNEDGSGDASVELPSDDYYDIYVSLDGYEPYYDGFYAEPGQTIRISPELEPVADGGDDGGNGSGGSN